MPAPISSTTPTAPGARRTRSRTPWTAGAGAGSPARSTRSTSADILDEVSAKRDWPKGSAGQLVGDFYARLHGRSPRSTQLGIKPVAAVAGRNRRDQGRGRRAAHDRPSCTRWTSTVPFGCLRQTDLHDPTQAIAQRLRRRPGPARPRLLPQAETALRRGAREVPRARGQDVRARRHRRRTQAKQHAQTGVRAREAPGRGLARQRRSCATRSSRTTRLRSPSCTSSRRLRLGHATSTPRGMPHERLNVTEPKFLQQLDQELADDAARRSGAPTWPWHVLERRCRLAVRALRRGELRLLRPVPGRREGDEAALEALRGGHRRPARRGARPEVRREVLPAGSQGAHAGDGQEHPAGDGRHHPRAWTG